MKKRKPFLAPRIPNPDRLDAGKYLNKIENFVNFYSKNPVKTLRDNHATYICECAEEFIKEILQNNIKKYSKPEIALRGKELRSRLIYLATEAGVRVPKNNNFKFIGDQD